VTGELDYSDVLRLNRKLRLARSMAPKRMDTWLHEVVGPELKTAMEEKAPVDTGYLKSHIVQINSPGMVSVGTHGVSYTRYVVEGTRAHEIRPKNSGVLVFKIGGMTVYAASVKHPGTAPNPFMQVAADEVIRRSLPRLAGILLELKRG
jgi:hypothetical protein